MPKKTKEGNIDLFYMNKVDGAENKKAPSKSRKRNAKINQKNKEKSDIFNFDDEIVIGISDQKTKQKNKAKVKNEIKSNNIKMKKKRKRKSPILFLIKWTSVLLLLIGTIIFILTTPMFNIKNINISGIEHLTKEQVISLSELNKNENLFKNSKSKITSNIKQTPYVESVIIKRKLPDTIDIQIKERKRSYMLKFVNGYVYIDTQGYILEISEEKLELPIISGYKTEEEKISEGNRLITEDLENLNNVLKITNSLEEIDVTKEIITNIDISNKEDYTVYLESENKTIHFGDASNLSNKILYVKAMIDSEKDIEGEIFVNGDINNKFRPFFREKV
mgnify:FL=1